jgi:hypothetical protein
VAPDRAALDPERVDQRLVLDRRGEMKPRRQRGDPRRPAIAGAIRDHEPAIRHRRDLRVERIELVAPAAVQDEQRHAARAFGVTPEVTII